MRAPIELAPGLHRIGGSIELDGRFSAFPPSATGWVPSNCYLIRSGGGALLIDTGFAVHEEIVLTHLRSLLHTEILSLALLRPSEFESLCNAGAILSAYSVRSVFSRMPAHQMVGFAPEFESRPEEEDATWPVGEIEWAWRGPGEPIEVDPDRPGTRRVETVTTPIRKTGATSWLYDPASRTLFTSDSFGYVAQAHPDEPNVLRDGDADETTVEDVVGNLTAKFDWLARANETVPDDIRKIFATHEVERIAPAHGCVLEGRTVVERHLGLMLDALESVGSPVGVR